MATVQYMPMRREESAPSFDPSQPRELVRYFEELEAHFDRCRISDLVERKRYTLRYVPMKVEDLWSCLRGWKAASSWDVLKLAVMARYPACQDAFHYSYADLLLFVERRRSLGDFSTVTEWSNYFNEYLVVSQHLLVRGLLCSLGQSRHLLASLSPHFHHEITSHIQRRDPFRDVESVPSIEEINIAACYCLGAGYRIAASTASIDPIPMRFDSTASTAPTTVPCTSSSIPAPATLTCSQLPQSSRVMFRTRASPDLQPVAPPGIPSLQSKLTRSDSACARSQSRSHSLGLGKDAMSLPQPRVASALPSVAIRTKPPLAVLKTSTTIGQRSEKELTVEPLVAKHHYREALALYAPPCDRVFASKPPKPCRTQTRSIQVAPSRVGPSTLPQVEDKSRDAYQSLLDSPVTIPVRDLIADRPLRDPLADRPKPVCRAIEDLRRTLAAPQQEATMTKKIDRELARQEYGTQPIIAVFPLSQALPNFESPHLLANDLAPKPNIEAPQLSIPELEPSIASLWHPECTELKKEALVPLASKLDHVPASFGTGTKSIIDQPSVLLLVYSILPTLFALMLCLALLSYTCFATSPSHRKHRARYRSRLPSISRSHHQALEC